MATAPTQPALYLVPQQSEEMVFDPKTNQVAVAPKRTPEQLQETVDWLANMHIWGMVAVPVVLMVASYWGAPRGPLFR